MLDDVGSFVEGFVDGFLCVLVLVNDVGFMIWVEYCVFFGVY